VNQLRVSILGKAVLLLQITALLLIQTYTFAPFSTASIPSEAEDEGSISHRRCGCPPERILSRTCCCFLANGSCSRNKNSAKELRRGKDNATIYLCAAPCGWPANLNINSAVNFEFLGAYFTFAPIIRSAIVAQGIQETLGGQFSRPQVPPPEISAPVAVISS